MIKPTIEENICTYEKFVGYGWWWLGVSKYYSAIGTMYGLKIGPLAIHLRFNIPNNWRIYE